MTLNSMAKNESLERKTERQKDNNGSLRNTEKSPQIVLARYNCNCYGSVVIDSRYTEGVHWPRQGTGATELNRDRDPSHQRLRIRLQIQFGGFRLGFLQLIFHFFLNIIIVVVVFVILPHSLLGCTTYHQILSVVPSLVS